MRPESVDCVFQTFDARPPFRWFVLACTMVMTKRIAIKARDWGGYTACGHTTLNAPVPVRSPKLSSVGPA